MLNYNGNFSRTQYRHAFFWQSVSSHCNKPLRHSDSLSISTSWTTRHGGPRAPLLTRHRLNNLKHTDLTLLQANDIQAAPLSQFCMSPLSVCGKLAPEHFRIPLLWKNLLQNHLPELKKMNIKTKVKLVTSQNVHLQLFAKL